MPGSSVIELLKNLCYECYFNLYQEFHNNKNASLFFSQHWNFTGILQGLWFLFKLKTAHIFPLPNADLKLHPALLNSRGVSFKT